MPRRGAEAWGCPQAATRPSLAHALRRPTAATTPCPQLLESSEQNEEPTTFEVGAGDIVGNRLFEVRGQAG